MLMVMDRAAGGESRKKKLIETEKRSSEGPSSLQKGPSLRTGLPAWSEGKLLLEDVPRK